MQILFLIGFIFLVASMFFYRIALQFGYILPRAFIGVQIALSILVIFLHAALIYSLWTALLFIGTSSGIGLLMEIAGPKNRLDFWKVPL